MWNPGDPASFVYSTIRVSAGWCAVGTRGSGLWRSCLPQPTAEVAKAAGGAGSRGTMQDGHPLLQEAAEFLQAYFEGRSVNPTLSLDLGDLRPFSRAVLTQCARIPWGEVVSYAHLAALAGRPGAARAVGQAMRRNPLPLFIPCHRVVGADGRLTGFGGGVKMKADLLSLEGREVWHEGAGKWAVEMW